MPRRRCLGTGDRSQSGFFHRVTWGRCLPGLRLDRLAWGKGHGLECRFAALGSHHSDLRTCFADRATAAVGGRPRLRQAAGRAFGRVRTYRPDLADELERELERVEKRIEEEDLDAAEAKQARERVFDSVRRKAQRTLRQAEEVAKSPFGSQEQVDRQKRVVQLIEDLKDRYFSIQFTNTVVVTGHLTAPGLEEEVTAEIFRLIEERRQAEQQSAEQSGFIPFVYSGINPRLLEDEFEDENVAPAFEDFHIGIHIGGGRGEVPQTQVGTVIMEPHNGGGIIEDYLASSLDWLFI